MHGIRLAASVSVLALAVACGLAACGSSESDEDKITSAIETAATSTNPSKCTEVETQKFVEQSTGESGKAALKTCEEQAAGESAESVDVSAVEVEGSDATAEAAVTGSAFDGQTLELALVEENGDWKVNELTGFANFNQQKLVEAFGEKFEESGEVEPELASCIVEGLEEAAPAAVEELFINNSGGTLKEIAEECQE